jgi:dTDP-4-amino-4,6-dideoxygalactose transaminase
MNQLPAFKNAAYIHEQDVSDRIYRNCLSLPCSTGLTTAEQDEVISLLKQFYND